MAPHDRPVRLWRLDPADRRQVTRALHDGTAVDDPRLAPVVVEQAERELRGADRWWVVWLGRLWGLVAVVVTVVAAATAAWRAAAIGLVWTALWVASEWARRRSRERLASAIESNR